MEKTPGDIIILHKYTKNYDHMLYCSWDVVRDRCNCYFSFLLYLTFYHLPPPSHPAQKMKISKKQSTKQPKTAQKMKTPRKWKKKKKTPGDIILHKCTKKHDHMLYCSWDTVHDRCHYFSFWAIFCPLTFLTA